MGVVYATVVFCRAPIMGALLFYASKQVVYEKDQTEEA